MEALDRKKMHNIDIGYTFKARYFAEAVVWPEQINKVTVRGYERLLVTDIHYNSELIQILFSLSNT